MDLSKTQVQISNLVKNFRNKRLRIKIFNSVYVDKHCYFRKKSKLLKMIEEINGSHNFNLVKTKQTTK
jgi:hypothetical protein